MHNTGRRRVLMIGLDAAEITLIERWMDEGWLPNLRRLRERGVFGPLASTAEWLVGSPWATFYTGQPPEEHGLIHYLIWRPETMALERPSPGWLPLPRFWHDLSVAGRRVIVVNVPLTYAPEPFDGIEISGFATHESLMAPASHPPELLESMQRTVAAAVADQEESRLLTTDEPLAIRDRANASTEAVTAVALSLMQAYPWDLFLLCFSATHRAGHALWDSTSLADPSSVTDQEMTEALRSVYIACDAALGRLLAEACESTEILVFSVHGMGPNTSRNSVLGEMLERVLAGDAPADGTPPQPSRLRRARELVPNEWRSWVKRQLPMTVQDRLTAYWRTGSVDWSTTRAFVPFCDLEGFVRVNLRGREAGGIVAPGDEYEHLLDAITGGLRSFVDLDTGEPVVADIRRGDELYADGQRRELIPDLIVRWSSQPAATHRRLVSPKHGAMAWPTLGQVPSGRSGHHRPTGFVFAAGDRFEGPRRLEGGHILDLAPSIFALLDLEAPAAMTGRPLF